MKQLPKVFVGALLAFISYIIITTSMQSNLFKEWDFLASIPWMRATLWDFYTNMTLILVLVWYREKNLAVKLLWTVLFATLGSIGSCLYFLIELFRLKPGESWTALFRPKDKMIAVV